MEVQQTLLVQSAYQVHLASLIVQCMYGIMQHAQISALIVLQGQLTLLEAISESYNFAIPCQKGAPVQSHDVPLLQTGTLL